MNDPSRQMVLKIRSFVVRVFPLPFVLVGVLALGFGLHGLYRAWESTTWPVAEGRIQSSAMDDQLGIPPGLWLAKGPGSSGTYHAKVHYTFTVGGQEFSGSRVSFGDYGASNPSHAQTIVDRYPKDKVVPVHYRVDAPGVCVLEPGIQAQAWFLPGFGLGFLVTGALMTVFLPKLLKNREPFGHCAGGVPAPGGEYRSASSTKYSWKMGVMRYNIIGLGFAGFCVLFGLLFAKISGVFDCSDTLKTVVRSVMYAVAGFGALGLLLTAVSLAQGISPYFEFEGRMFRNFLPRAFGYKRVEIDLSQKVTFAKMNATSYLFTDGQGVETKVEFVLGTPMGIVVQNIREANPSITITDRSHLESF